VSKFLIRTHASNGLKKSHILILPNVRKYLNVKVASLATVKSCVTVDPVYWWQMFGPV